LPRLSAVASRVLIDIHNDVSEKTISRFDNKVYRELFSTNKKAVDSEMEVKESKDNESDEEATDKSQKPNASRYEKKFNTRWLNNYSWLKHDSEKGVLCELCIRILRACLHGGG